MIFDKLTAHLVKLPLKTAWHTAYGIEHFVETIILNVKANGIDEFIEICPLSQPSYLPDSAKSVLLNLQEFIAPRVKGQNFESAKEILDCLSIYKGNSFAKSAIEIAWWAITCHQQSKALHQMFPTQNLKPRAGTAIPIYPDKQSLIMAIEEAVAQGYSRIKLKVCRNRELEIIKTAREAYPDLEIHIDCNGTYTIDDIALFKEIDQYQLAMIEQPFHYRDLHDHAHLQSKIDTPVCLDESITEKADTERVIRYGICQALCLKPAKIGGISVTRDIIKAAKKAGIKCWIGGMLESEIGTAMNIELATLCDNSFAHDFPVSGRYYSTQLTNEPINLDSKHLNVSIAPWTGKTLNQKTLSKVTFKSIDLI